MPEQEDIMCLIKVISSTPLVSVFRLAWIQPIIVALPLLILLKDDSLHLSVPLPYSVPHSGTRLLLHWLTLYTLSDTHRAFTHCQHQVCTCLHTVLCVWCRAFPREALLGLVLERLAVLSKHLKVGKYKEKEAENQEITSGGEWVKLWF